MLEGCAASRSGSLELRRGRRGRGSSRGSSRRLRLLWLLLLLVHRLLVSRLLRRHNNWGLCRIIDLRSTEGRHGVWLLWLLLRLLVSRLFRRHN
jgi:hypothetical protein